MFVALVIAWLALYWGWEPAGGSHARGTRTDQRSLRRLGKIGDNEMARTDDTVGRLATAAFPCWLLSFSWLPLAFTGREGEAVRYLILAGEAGALLAALLAIGFGIVARRCAPPATAHRRRAARGLAAGVIALSVVVGLNILGAILA